MREVATVAVFRVRRARSLGAFLLAGFAAFSVGCGETDTDEAEEEGTPLEEACEHHAEGPFVSISAATTDALGGLPDASAEHTSTQVALGGAAGAAATGYVGFAAVDAGTYEFFLTEDVPFAMKSSAGAELAVTAVSVAGGCSQVVAAYSVVLPVGTAVIELGPTEADSVSIVHERTTACNLSPQ